MGISQFAEVALASTVSGSQNWTGVLLSGVFLVAVVLIVLYVLIALERAMFGTSGKKAAQPEPVPAAAAPVRPASAPVVSAGVPSEVVAAISAAIACMEQDGVGYTVQSIEPVVRKAGASRQLGRSAWAQAGVLSNTQPF